MPTEVTIALSDAEAFLPKVVGSEFGIVQNFRKEADADYFAGVDRNDGSTAIRMLKEVVAAFDSMT